MYASMPEARSAATNKVDLSLQSPKWRLQRFGREFGDQARRAEFHAGVAHLAMQALDHLADVFVTCGGDRPARAP